MAKTDNEIISLTLQHCVDSGDKPSARWLKKNYRVGHDRAVRIRDKTKTQLAARDAPEPLIDFEERENSATLTARMMGGDRIITVEQLIAKAQVDLRIWEPKPPEIRKWDVVTKDANGEPQITEAFAIKVGFRARPGGKQLVDLFDDILLDIKNYAPAYPNLSHNIPNDDGHLFVVSIPDAHFGKYAWAQETGEDYDVKIAKRLYDKAVDDLLALASPLPISRVLYVIGNDLLHVDTSLNTTTAGTLMDVDGSWQKAYRAAFKSSVRAIESMRDLATVDIIIQPGNHDNSRAWLLGEALGAWFRNADGVRVFNEPSPRRYYPLGRVLLGITHGDGEKLKDLPGIMASETGEAWTKARRREWLIGHFHRRRDMGTMPVADERGVLVRTLPSLSAADAWHTKRGYYGQRAALGLAYRVDGLIVHEFTVALAEDERRMDGIFVINA